jgi:hypothetical protein
MIDRTRTARIVGVLFIMASALAIVGGSLVAPFGEDGFVSSLASDRAQVVSGVILELALGVTVIAIAAMILPILREGGEGLASWYLGVRVAEGALVAVAASCALVGVTLSETFGVSGAAGIDPVADALVSTREWAYLVGTMVVFGVSAVILNAVLYRTVLVPRWISVWGLIGAVLLLVSAALELYGSDPSTTVQAVLAAPIAINEMVLAVWLIARGFAGPRVQAEQGSVVGAST